ncbi:titin isoform X2 [Bacillus rossius redtenbacheri]|uniref:titin isoform X2 n=1 Tax=Bacillus rossius redtenbacheri TaxID=93214 RepID=UPI002FDD043A
MSGDGGQVAVEAISDRLAEVTSLAEQLDAALCGLQRAEAPDHAAPDMRRILDGTASTAPEDWYASGRRPDGARSEDEFVTASECTCTPPSRSSSFHTASLCDSLEADHVSEPEEATPVVRTTTEVRTGVLVHEVTETTRVRLSRGDSSGTTSCTVTTETLRSGPVLEEREVVVVAAAEPEPAEDVDERRTAEEDDHHDDDGGDGGGQDDPVLAKMAESREWLQLKVLEAEPELARLGASLQEALELQRAHDDVLLQLQSKQSPVEELLRQADQLISTQRPRAEVYAAMADSLGLAWKDVNSHLEQRKQVLDLNVSYHSRAEDCHDRMRALEAACRDSLPPADAGEVKALLARLHDCRRLALEALMSALQEGRLLLDTLRELANRGTLDSRPDRTRTSSEYAVSQAEHWLEELHDRRRALDGAWLARKARLEQSLALLLLAGDLRHLEDHLGAGREALGRTSDQLGDSSASVELLLHEHRKLLPEAKDMQDRALKITRATEQLASSGHFAVEQATAKSYSVLSACAGYLDDIEQREALLTRAIAFFRSAHTALTKLDQLEVQLRTAEPASSSSPRRAALHAQVGTALEDVTACALREGHALLDVVGRSVPGSEGVKRTVEEIEDRKIALGQMCTANREENLRVSQAFTAFLEKQNELYSWLVSIAEAFLQGHQDMGSNLPMAQDFLDLHQQLLSDLQRKGAEVNSLLLTLPPILEHLDDERREDADRKVDALHSQWVGLKALLEARVDLAATYARFHELAERLGAQLDALERELQGAGEDSARDVEQEWLGIEELYDQLSSTGKTFLAEASKVRDPYLDVKRACLCVETLLGQLGGRQLTVQRSWQTWQSSVVVEREFQELWERHMTESRTTVDWVSRLDAQLYPVLTGSSSASKVIGKELEEKFNAVLPELRRAQTEIDMRIRTAESLALRGDCHSEKEQIVGKLTQLHSKLQVAMTDYQILLQMLIAFFKNLAELEKTIENLNSQYVLTRVPSVAADAELQLKEHEASRQAVLELFKFAGSESEQIIARIHNQEPEEAAAHDADRVRVLLREKREAWEAAWAERRLRLEQHGQLCRFDADLHQINATLADLGRQLETIRGQYGESLAGARATSQAFVYFEKTIELLEVRIQAFVSMGEQLLSTDHASAPHIRQELAQLQSRWAAFHKQVVERRRLVDLSIQYFTLVEEAEEWFREGSKLLVTIARKSTSVRTPEEATQLLDEVELFLKPGEARQDERIRKISTLAYELYGEEQSKQLTLVVTENREMIDSFTIIRNELSILTQNLRAAEEQKQRHQKELEEVDATLAAARAEAAAAQAAAAAAEEARRAAEAAARALQEAPPLIEETVQKAEAIPLPPPSEPEPEPDKEPEKPPTPPPKKAKYVDEQPKPVAPIFTLPLCDAAVSEGEKVTFECRVTGIPMPEVVWYKDGISIQNNPDYQTTFEHGICQLKIEETFTEDSAKFTCKAANGAGTAETSATLAVKEAQPEEQLRPPVFTRPLEPGAAREGSSHRLECRVEGVPLPVVQWFKDDACVDNCPDYLITYNNGDAALRFEEVFLEDQAVYTCRAANPLGAESCSARLTVEPLEPTEAPTFTVPLSNVMARAGQKIKLECAVAGLPPPEVTWSHNGKPVKETRDIKIQRDGDKATLVVSEAFPKDAGAYAASARSAAGEATCSCSVSVKGRLPTETSDSELASDLEPARPAVQLPLKDVCVFEGKRVRLDCVIVGQPEPEVIWYHDDRPVKESDDFKLLFQGDRCSLIIGEVFSEDAGEYKVVAINSGGEASSRCNLSVQTISGDAEPATRQQASKVVVEPVGTAPKFGRLLTDVLASEGDQVVLECCVEGEPRPSITWLLNNREIASTDGIQIAEDGKGNVSLTIVKAQPGHKGVYTVRASNVCGEAKCFANLIVKSFGPADIKRPEPQRPEKETPAFKELFADRSILENQSTKFECVISGKPQPKVQWLFNDKPVAGKEFLQSSVGDRHVLTLQRAQKEHCGRYACVADNEAGKATCVAFLSVMEDYPKDTKPAPAPLIERSTVAAEKSETSSSFSVQKSTIVQSSSSQLTQSTGGGEPRTQVHSFSARADHLREEVDRKPVVEIRSQKVEESHQVDQHKPVEHKHSSLSMTSGREEASDSSSTPVSSPRPARKSVAPRFVSPLMGKIVDQGADVVLTAIVDGFPACEVAWTKNGQPLAPKEGSVAISYKLNKAQLELKNVSVKDGGRYTCTATNPAGSASSTADVVVKKTVFPPVFGRRLQAQMAKAGERVVMEVEATGTPDPTVTWYKDDKQILGAVPGQMFRTKIQGNSYSLIIEKASPEYSGKYTVKATNCCGEAQSIADFLVLEPDADRDVLSQTVVQNVTHTSMQKHEKEEKKSVKVEQQPAPPQVQSAKAATQKVSTPSSIAPLGAPIISESLLVEEMVKSEKHVSIKMDRTPSPATQKPAAAPPAAPEKTVADVKTWAPKETEIPITVEGPSIPEQPEPQPPPKETTEDAETTGIDTDSIPKQSALDFFKGKLKDAKDDSKSKQTEEEISLVDTGASTTVTDIKSQFEIISTKEERISKEVPSKPAGDDKPLPKSQAVPISQFLPKQFGSVVDKHPQISSSMKSEFHTESSSFESRTSQTFTHHSASQSMEEFNLLPEPPPEICFTPKTEVHEKPKLDMPSRAKILEDSQRILSPVEIPSGAIKIFPSPAKTETQAAKPMETKITPSQKQPPTKKPESPVPVRVPPQVSTEKEVFRKEVVEEVQVEKKIHATGSDDWSYRPTPHITVPKHPAETKPLVPPVETKPWTLPVETKPWKPTVETKTWTPPVEIKPWTPPVSAAKPHPPPQVTPTPPAPKPCDQLPVEPPWSTTLDSQKFSSSTTKTSISESSTSAFSTVHPAQLKRAASPRPSAEGVAMEKLWTPHKPSEPEPLIPRPVSAGPQRAASPKPSMEGLAMDKLWAHKHPDSALKRAWPPPQPVEEKPVVPWAARVEPDKVWPPQEKDAEPASTTTQIIKETEDVSRKHTVFSTETIKQPQQDVKHYIAEAKYQQSSLLMNDQFQPAETFKTFTETRETTSKHSEEILSEFHSIQQTSQTKESSPPVIEERVLKPSETKKFWPPGGKIDSELKAPIRPKESTPKRQPFPKPVIPAPSVNGDIQLEPEPPPQMGYAPPPLERRQSYVEAIEQDLERGLDKEPSKHLVGAVRTIPPPPQREKSLTPGPPTPQRERSLPPPLPPKEKAPPPQVFPAKPAPKVKTKPLVESKPFETFPKLEPFPYQPEPSRPKPSKCPPPPKPSKFIKGEFASSDYESDMEMVHIKPKWRPYESDTEDFTYKRVLPPAATPQPKRPKSTEPEPPPPSKFDLPPQFDGPPRPKSDVFHTTRSEVTHLTSKTEVKSEKVKTKKRHSPPPMKPGSPPQILHTATPEEKQPTSPVKAKPDSPKSKQKTFRMPQQDSGYMADTDEPRTLRMSHHKSTVRHEETRTCVEQTTSFSEKFTHQSSEQEQQKTAVQDTAPPARAQPSFRAHHRHVEHKAAVPAPVKPKKEMITSSIVRDEAVVSAQSIQDERASSLEPFPFTTEPVRPIAKRSLGPPPPSPSKFVKGEFRESDYESDYEGRIPALWRPIDSDVDEPSYRPVRAVLQPGQRRSYSAMEIQSPAPPTEFDTPPQFSGPPRPKFEPIDKPAVVKREKKPERVQATVKPKPIAPKAPPMEVIVATPAVKKEPYVTLRPESPPEIGFAPPPKTTYTARTKVSNFPNATQTETSKVMKFAESTEHTHRVMSVQQTMKVIKFGEKENEAPPLEPFPFKPEQAKPVRRYSGPPPTTPKKFVPGEFKESDYESDYESMRFKPKWVPGGSDSEEPQYRKVRAPLLTRSSSVPMKPSAKVPAPVDFESQVPHISTPELSKAGPVALEQDAEQKRLRRVEEMRKRFSETTSQSKTSQRQATNLIIEPGEPPEIGFMGGRIPTATSYAASKHINEMTSTFKSKAQQFVDDIISDVQSSKQVSKPEKPILKPAPKQEVPQIKTGDEPQAYREETRVSEHGTKHIDPDTGLIYFKYDFGYEFGIVLPGEGKTKDDNASAKRPRIDKKSEDAVDFPVIHEKSGGKTQPAKGDPAMGDKAPLFRPKKFTHSKAVKWEPVSESEMSEAEGDGAAHKKRYSLPQPPHISIPGASRWDQSTPSPVSLSPSLPSLSPRHPGVGPAGPDPAVSPGGSWQAATPTKVAGRGRAGTPTPPSTPSTPGSLTGQPHKPPSFITPLRDIAVVSGQTARFECIVQAEPQPNILWSKNGRIIENSEDYQIHYRNGVCRLTIPQAYPEDAGNYTCTATNMFGTIGTSSSLQVPGVPSHMYGTYRQQTDSITSIINDIAEINNLSEYTTNQI